jgi:hypothetical protein
VHLFQHIAKVAMVVLWCSTSRHEGADIGLAQQYTHKATKSVHHTRMCMLNDQVVATTNTMHKLALAPEWVCVPVPLQWSSTNTLSYLSLVECKVKQLWAHLDSLL